MTSMSFISLGLSSRARIPAWMAGWSVLTRPPNISAKWVMSETSRTWSPCSLKVLAVPPDAIRSRLAFCNAVATSTIPVLSETERIAEKAIILMHHLFINQIPTKFFHIWSRFHKNLSLRKIEKKIKWQKPQLIYF